VLGFILLIVFPVGLSTAEKFATKKKYRWQVFLRNFLFFLGLGFRGTARLIGVTDDFIVSLGTISCIGLAVLVGLYDRYSFLFSEEKINKP